MASQFEPGRLLSAERAKYVETGAALYFPASADLPETQLHLDLRTLLYQLLSDYLGETYTVGSDQFVYLDASNPKRCIAPDVYLKHAPRGEPIKTWKVWERGAPDLAIEVLSDTDSKPGKWEDKLAFYQACGVQELVSIDLLSDVPRLRVWNRVNTKGWQRVTRRRAKSSTPGAGQCPTAHPRQSALVHPIPMSATSTPCHNVA